MRKIDIPAVFKADADDLAKVRDDSKRIHSTGNIRAAGDEVEQPVREYFRRMIPSKYYVTHGHIIDCESNVSPQLDLIIADKQTLPSLLTTKDGTEYVPIETVYAIAEIKSTFYRQKRYIETFSDTIRTIREDFVKEEVPNTAVDGIADHTLLRDMVLPHGNRILNHLFAFMLFVDSGDFNFTDVSPIFSAREKKHLPNVTVLLNKGIIHCGLVSDQQVDINRYPEWPKHENERWFLCPYDGTESGSPAGNHLGFLYYAVLQHLMCSLVEAPPLWKYMGGMMTGRRSTLEVHDGK